MALRVFRPPLPATVEVRAGRPVRVFSSSGVRGEVVSAAGPWRTSGEWWTEDGWQQEEWDIEILSVVRGPWSVAAQSFSSAALESTDTDSKMRTTKSRKGKGQRATDNGQQTGLYRIYQDLGSGSWFVRGIYD